MWFDNPTSRYISKENKTTISKRYLHSHVHCNISHSSQDKCSSENEWIKKFDIDIDIMQCQAIKKKEILPFTMTCINLEDIMLSEISQTQKDKSCMISLICRVLKTKSQIHSERMIEYWLPGAGKWEKWVDAGESIQTFNYNMNKFWRPNGRQVTIINATLLYTCNLLNE